MSVARRIEGLYAVTPDRTDTGLLLAAVEAALSGGAAVIQYRNKQADAALRTEQAGALLSLCRAHGVPLIVNDDLALALRIDAAGVHLGAEDGSLEEARLRLGPQRLLGASCYARLDTAIRAQAAGADYVALGSFFASVVKPGAVHAPVGLLREARRRLRVPIVAIGGITRENAPQLIESGADSVAVISAVFGAADVRAAARGFAELFATART